MLNPVSANDLIQHQQQEFKHQEVKSSDSTDSGTASDSVASDDNPARATAEARANQKMEGSDQSQRNTVSPTSMINTANETMINQAIQIKKLESSESKVDGVGMPNKGMVADDFKNINEQSVFEKVRDSNPLTSDESTASQEAQAQLFDSEMSSLANDQIFNIAEFQATPNKSMDQATKNIDEQMSQIREVKAEAPERVKGSDDNKWDSAKMEEMANSVSGEMSENGAQSMNTQANISPEQTLAMLR